MTPISGAAARSLIDQAELGARFKLVMGLLSISLAFELFDFFIVGFLVTAVAPAWGLSFGQSAIVLLIASVGAMIGASAGGAMADRFGRKPVLLIGATIYPIAAAAVGMVPDGDWISFSILRFIVGLAYGFGGVAQFALIVELAPTRLRTLLSSASMVPIAVGFVLAPSAMALLHEPLGWRGLAFLCAFPLLFVLPLALLVPESPSWLLSKGGTRQAIRAAARLFSQPENMFAAPAPLAASSPRPSSAGRLLDHKKQFAFCAVSFSFHSAAVAGLLLWGPLVVAMLLGVSPQKAASYFILVGISGLIGRFLSTYLAHRLGRRVTGQIGGYGAAIIIAIGVLYPHATWLGLNAFVASLIAAALFFDGAYANLQPHPAEIFPVSVAVSHVASGMGKIAGPMILAVLAGTSNVVRPEATVAVVTPGFLTMACLFAVGAAAFTFLGTAGLFSSIN